MCPDRLTPSRLPVWADSFYCDDKPDSDADHAAFLAAALCALWTADQRFLVAATIRALPAADIFRFGFAAGFSASAFSALAAAQRLFWANAIRRRAAALMVRFFGADPFIAVTAGVESPNRV